jgi:hypothetical protein
MAILGFFLFLAGSGALGWSFLQRLKARKILNAPLVPTGKASASSASGKGGAISAEGMAVCERLLASPITGSPCLYWEYEVTAEWKETVWNQTQGKAEEKRERKVIESRRAAADFAIDDGSGPVRIDASDGGSFDLEKIFDDSSCSGSLGNLRVPLQCAPQGAVFSAEERILRPGEKLYVCGKSMEGGKIGAPGVLGKIPGLSTNLLISTKQRDQLLDSAMRSAKGFLIGGAVSFTLGLLVMAVAPSPETILAAEPTIENTFSYAPESPDTER